MPCWKAARFIRDIYGTRLGAEARHFSRHILCVLNGLSLERAYQFY